MKYTIDDLKNGVVAVVNDGSKEQLYEVIKLAFGEKKSLKGTNKFYEKWQDFVYGSDETTLPTQSVKDFT